MWRQQDGTGYSSYAQLVMFFIFCCSLLLISFGTGRRRLRTFERHFGSLLFPEINLTWKSVIAFFVLNRTFCLSHTTFDCKNTHQNNQSILERALEATRGDESYLLAVSVKYCKVKYWLHSNGKISGKEKLAASQYKRTPTYRDNIHKCFVAFRL